MPEIICTCCDYSVEEVRAISCFVCKKYFKHSCVELNLNDIKSIKNKKGVTWSCANCTTIYDTVSVLKETITMLQGEIMELRDAIKNSNKSEKNELCMEEIISEIADRDRRKRNVVVFNVKESESKESAVVNNKRVIDEIFNQIGMHQVIDNLKYNRLGKYDNSRRSPRPMRITLSSENQVHEVLRNARKLLESDNLKHIRISTDKTRRQIEYYNSLKTLLDQRIKSGEKDLRIKYVQGIPQIVSTLN